MSDQVLAALKAAFPVTPDQLAIVKRAVYRDMQAGNRKGYFRTVCVLGLGGAGLIPPADIEKLVRANEPEAQTSLIELKDLQQLLG